MKNMQRGQLSVLTTDKIETMFMATKYGTGYRTTLPTVPEK